MLEIIRAHKEKNIFSFFLEILNFINSKRLKLINDFFYMIYNEKNYLTQISGDHKYFNSIIDFYLYIIR